MPPPDRNHDGQAEAAFSIVRRTPHPLGCFTEPVRLPHALEDYPFRRTYVKATDESQPSPFWTAARHAQASPDWEYREIATSHLVPVNRPAELADLLLQLG
ncbi:MAG TPA: hypothetical protein VGI58_05265 [Streptosporangiaceae bacterium]